MQLDTLLHLSSQPTQIMLHDPNGTTGYTENRRIFDECLSDSPPISCAFQGGFGLLQACDKTLQDPLPQTVSNAPLPCSLDQQSDGSTNLANASLAWPTLQNGIKAVGTSFVTSDLAQLENDIDRNRATSIQIVTQPSEGQNYSFYFDPFAAAQYTLTDTDYGDDDNKFGADFVASTISISTECSFATTDCNMHNNTASRIDENNQTISYECFSGFSGNLGRTPFNGHERAQGWDMSFYQPASNGTLQTIPLQAQANPFQFFAVASVNSLSPNDTFTNSATLPSDLVSVGGGALAFALSCKSTVYNHNLIFNSSDITLSNPTLASPAKASIFQSPLQAGFGQYHLYQAATLAMLDSSTPLNTSMAQVFNQVALALASGVVESDANLWQRLRHTALAGMIPKRSFWFVVTLCLLYPAVGLGMFIWAVVLRRDEAVRHKQERLLENCDLRVFDLSNLEEMKEKTKENRKSWREEGEDEVLEVNVRPKAGTK